MTYFEVICANCNKIIYMDCPTDWNPYKGIFAKGNMRNLNGYNAFHYICYGYKSWS